MSGELPKMLHLGTYPGGKPHADWTDEGGDQVSFHTRADGAIRLLVTSGVDAVDIPPEKLAVALAYIGFELPAKRMTAREHLDAAWDAAHVPPDGVIPPRAECMSRNHETGYVSTDYNRSSQPLATRIGPHEFRLLAPPAAPAWARDGHIMATLPNGNTAMLQRVDTGWLSFDGETYTVDQLRDVKRVNVEGENNE